MKDFMKRLLLFLQTPKTPFSNGLFPSLSRSQRVWIVLWICGTLMVVCAIIMLLNLSMHTFYGFNLARPYLEAGSAVATPLIPG